MEVFYLLFLLNGLRVIGEEEDLTTRVTAGDPVLQWVPADHGRDSGCGQVGQLLAIAVVNVDGALHVGDGEHILVRLESCLKYAGPSPRLAVVLDGQFGLQVCGEAIAAFDVEQTDSVVIAVAYQGSVCRGVRHRRDA